jgi:hypothetical protein
MDDGRFLPVESVVGFAEDGEVRLHCHHYVHHGQVLSSGIYLSLCDECGRWTGVECDPEMGPEGDKCLEVPGVTCECVGRDHEAALAEDRVRWRESYLAENRDRLRAETRERLEASIESIFGEAALIEHRLRHASGRGLL